ncbi:MAG TPA: DNA adenine methylase [Bacillota bacterium]|nr:DNA adenine methylase [Bacillota bacterium]
MVFRQHNRKYIGSKAALLDFICKTIEEVAGDLESCTFLDPFAGTGVVAAAFAGKAKEVIASDLLYANYAANRAFLCTTEENADLDKVVRLIHQLNQLEGEEGYVVEHYGGTYFTLENAQRIQAVRERIAFWQQEALITEQEFYILLTSLLYAVDKVANTCGQYDSYLKNLGQPPFSSSGVHLVDGLVYSRLHLHPLAVSLKGNCQVFCRDANQLVAELPAEILYLDPPYNTRQYCDNYHVLENIARWQKPPTFGKTRKFDRRGLRSRYSQRRHAAEAFRELVERARCRYLFLSYNSEGIISDEEILAVLRKKGKVAVREEPYPVFGRGAGRAKARKLTERLFCCIVD